MIFFILYTYNIDEEMDIKQSILIFYLCIYIILYMFGLDLLFVFNFLFTFIILIILIIIEENDILNHKLCFYLKYESQIIPGLIIYNMIIYGLFIIMIMTTYINFTFYIMCGLIISYIIYNYENIYERMKGLYMTNRYLLPLIIGFIIFKL